MVNMHSEEDAKANRIVNSDNALDLESELRGIFHLDGIEIRLVSFCPSGIFFNGYIPTKLKGEKGRTVEIGGVEYFYAFHGLYNRQGEKVDKI
jgi:hypothetical protein